MASTRQQEPPLPPSDEALADVSSLAEEALTWCSLHGLVVGDAQGEASGSQPGVGMVHAPTTLIPTPFPSQAFFLAYTLAPLLNELVDRVSQDRDFLTSTLSSAAKTDSFTAALLGIYANTHEEQGSKTIRMGMHRSDYMLDMGSQSSAEGAATPALLQVELNTIASSFPGLSSRVTDLHRHLQGMGFYADMAGLGTEQWRIPPNPAASAMAEALATAWRAARSHPEAVVLMVVQPGERNLYDQRWLLQELWGSHKIRAIQRTLTQLAEEAELRGEDKELWIGTRQVSVVYFRAGYSPQDYPSAMEWEARLVLEQSCAVSCPSIAYHLTGAKKVQQKLAESGVLEKFIPDQSTAQLIRSCFAGLWSLEPTGDASSGNGASTADASTALLERLSAAVRDALDHPEKYVLKPQREGGGNNIYGEDVRTRLQEMLSSSNPEENLAAYILMQRIWPAERRTLMMRRGKSSWEDSLSELGVYGVYVRSGPSVLLSKAAGHLLRTKTSTSDEGGVATGYAVLDSPYLV